MNKLFRKAAFVCLFLKTFTSSAQTEVVNFCVNHSCCSAGNDVTPANVMISHVHNKNEFMLSYKYMTMNMSGILSGTQAVDKSNVFVNYLMSPDKMRMDMHMLMGMYGVTDRLTIMGMVNYNTTDMYMTFFSASAHHHAGAVTGDTSLTHYMTSSGLGDVKLNALYALIKTPNQQLILGAGASIPTGNIKFKGASDESMYANSNYPYAMQLGSGTFDVLPVVSYLFQKNKLTFSTQASGIIRTGYNSQGYNLGNEISLNTWCAYQWLPFLSSSIRVEGNAANKISGVDPTLYAFNELSANTSNYGGKKVTGAIGSVFKLKRGFFKNNRLSVEYVLPVYQNLNGTQMKFANSFTASWSLGF